MENKDSKFKWNSKNNSMVFGLCLAGVAALSVLFAMGQVKNAEREKNEAEQQNEAALEDMAQGNSTFVPQVDEAIRNALDQTESGLAVLQNPEEQLTASREAASGEISAETEPEGLTEEQTEAMESTVESKDTT